MCSFDHSPLLSSVFIPADSDKPVRAYKIIDWNGYNFVSPIQRTEWDGLELCTNEKGSRTAEPHRGRAAFYQDGPTHKITPGIYSWKDRPDGAEWMYALVELRGYVHEYDRRGYLTAAGFRSTRARIIRVQIRYDDLDLSDKLSAEAFRTDMQARFPGLRVGLSPYSWALAV